jgi:hypothetical protein
VEAQVEAVAAAEIRMQGAPSQDHAQGIPQVPLGQHLARPWPMEGGAKRAQALRG